MPTLQDLFEVLMPRKPVFLKTVRPSGQPAHVWAGNTRWSRWHTPAWARHLATARWIALGCLLALPAIACRSADPGVHRKSAGPRHEQSVKPGINDSYVEPDVDTWIKRFESESREIFKHRRRIVDSLEIKSGIVLGDIGAGTGLFTPLFAEAVGPGGKVVAVDIVPEFLQLIRTRARKDRLFNVQTVLSDEDSITLPRASIDLAFICDTYHHFEYPESTMTSIHRALKPGGELIVIDFDRIVGKSREWIIGHVRAGREVVTREITTAGFVLVGKQPDGSFLDENYVLRFRKTE